MDPTKLRRWRGAHQNLRVSREWYPRNFAARAGRLSTLGCPVGGNPEMSPLVRGTTAPLGALWVVPREMSPLARGTSAPWGAPRVVPQEISPLARGTSATSGAPGVVPPKTLPLAGGTSAPQGVPWVVPRNVSPLARGASTPQGVPWVARREISTLARGTLVTWVSRGWYPAKLRRWRGPPQHPRVSRRWYPENFAAGAGHLSTSGCPVSGTPEMSSLARGSSAP